MTAINAALVAWPTSCGPLKAPRILDRLNPSAERARRPEGWVTSRSVV
jgi:hypothetical protein